MTLHGPGSSGAKKSSFLATKCSSCGAERYPAGFISISDETEGTVTDSVTLFELTLALLELRHTESYQDIAARLLRCYRIVPR